MVFIFISRSKATDLTWLVERFNDMLTFSFVKGEAATNVFKVLFGAVDLTHVQSTSWPQRPLIL